MTRQTFALAATRIIGVVSGFWLLQFVETIVRVFRTLLRLFPDHHISYFPVVETMLAFGLAGLGIIIGLRSTKIAKRFEAAPRTPFRLPILFGLAAAAYMTGFICCTSIQIGTIESVASYKELHIFEVSRRQLLGFKAPTTQLSRLVGPGIALGIVAAMGFGLFPPRRQGS